MKCVWLKAWERDPKLPWSGHVQSLQPPVDWELQGTSSWLNFLSGTDNHKAVIPIRIRGRDQRRYTTGRFEKLLREGKWVAVGEVNPPDGADVAEFMHVATTVAEAVDVISVTEHPSATNHMSSVPAAALLEASGIETVTTFTCRDKNRIALQGDLLGAVALGIKNLLLVTGNHMVLGDHPNAKPVFDLDSINLIRLARRLRDEGTYDSGRALDSRPAYLIGGAAGPFAPPRDMRALRVAKKATAGANFIISQHIFELRRWKEFVRELMSQGTLDSLYLLGAVAVIPSPEVAQRLNRTLTGFRIPDATLKRFEQAGDPHDTGIDVAAETIRELRDMDGVSGCLIATLAGGQRHVMTTHSEEADITSEVLRRAGLSDEVGSGRRPGKGQKRSR